MFDWLRSLLGPSRSVKRELDSLKIDNVVLDSKVSRLKDVTRIQEQELAALKNKARVVSEPVPAPAKVAKAQPKSSNTARRTDTPASASSTPTTRNDDSLLTNPVHAVTLYSAPAYSSPSRDCSSSSYDSGSSYSSSSYDSGSSSSSSSCDSGSF